MVYDPERRRGSTELFSSGKLPHKLHYAASSGRELLTDLLRGRERVRRLTEAY
jgi:hypothetical protein